MLIVRPSSRVFAAVLSSFALVLASCGSDDASVDAGASERPTVVVTTNILGDVVANLVGDEFNVVTIMPVGTDPHDFQASAQEADQISAADVLIVNGAGFEEGLLDVVTAAETDGVPVFEVTSAVSTLEFGEDSHHDEHGDEDHDEEHGDEDHDEEHGDEDHDEEHGDEDHDEEHGDEDHDDHGHEGVDPHFFTDPARMVAAANGIVAFLADNVAGTDRAGLEANAAAYIEELEALDQEVEATLEAVSADRRVLVTSHEVFGYFADRYDFEVIGAVIPSGTTVDAVSAQELADLAELIEHEGVPAIFADTSSSGGLSATLADEVGDVAVVELFSESLGADDSGGDTYLDMVRANATRIADALSG